MRHLDDTKHALHGKVQPPLASTMRAYKEVRLETKGEEKRSCRHVHVQHTGTDPDVFMLSSEMVAH